MGKAECPVINAIGNWVLRSIDLKGYIFGDLAPEVKLKNIQAQGRLIPKKRREEILRAMEKPVIVADSTPVALLTSHDYAELTHYDAKAEKARADCINSYCPGYFRFAAIACLGCNRKYEEIDYWGWETTKVK